MYGAILGDIIGSPYEFDRGSKTKDFQLFIEESDYTDDSVMTIAVADALMLAGFDATQDEIRSNTIESMRRWFNRYQNVKGAYGGRFLGWLRADAPEPYNSLGNGAAMRVSAVGWMYDTLERTLEVSDAVTDVTHNHPEGIKGARATAATIFMARNGATKDEIRKYITEVIGYDLSRTCDEIRPTYHHDETCMKTVPEAITAFLESDSYEDAVRTAVSLGGDTDTLGAICGAMAEAFFGIPEELKEECRQRIGEDMLEVLSRFDSGRL